MITAAESSELRRLALELGATEFISKPIDHPEFKARIRNLCELRRARTLLADKAERLEKEVEKAVATIRARAVELLLRLARAVEARTQGSTLPSFHGDRVGHLCAVIAMGMGMDSAYQAQMIAAGATHDIGLLSVPDRVLQAQAPLSAPEEAAMRSHAQAGHYILDGSRDELAKMAAAIALSHHDEPSRTLGWTRIPSSAARHIHSCRSAHLRRAQCFCMNCSRCIPMRLNKPCSTSIPSRAQLSTPIAWRLCTENFLPLWLS